MKHQDSWLIDESCLIKITDKSFFFEPSTGVPKKIVLEWFITKKIYDGSSETFIDLVFQDVKYQGRLVKNNTGRVVLHLSRDFIHHVRIITGFAYEKSDLKRKDVFKSLDYPLIKFVHNNGMLFVSVCKSTEAANIELVNNIDCGIDDVNIFVYGNIKKTFEQVDPPNIKIEEIESTIAKSKKQYKPDYVARQLAATKIGLEGELIVLELIKAHIESFGGSESLKNSKVEHVSSLDDGLGFDILVYSDDGTEMYIEVKTTKNSIDTPFYISENELDFSEKNPKNYYLYRLFDFNYSATKVKYYVINGNLRDQLNLFPIKYISTPRC